MDINAIKTFLEVAKTRHFGRAAEALFVSQSTVSARIQSLEDALGAQLFVRERGNIHLSDAGEALMIYAKGITTLWNRAQLEIAHPSRSPETIAIGGLSSVWDTVLQDWVYNISQQHPKLIISADIYSTQTLIKRVNEGALDIAFLYDAPQTTQLTAKPLKAIKLVMVCSTPVKELEPDWASYFIQVDWGRNFAVQFAAQFPDVRSRRMLTSLGRIALEQLKRTHSYAYLAEPAVRASVNAGELFIVPNTPTFKRKAHAIYNVDSDRAGLIQDLLELLQVDRIIRLC